MTDDSSNRKVPEPSRVRLVETRSSGCNPTGPRDISGEGLALDSTPVELSATATPHDERPTLHDPTPTVDAHANAHSHENPSADPAFPHARLDAYRVALELAALSNKLAKEIPRGHRSIADHMLRAAANTVLLLAEGANRRGAAQKRQRFVESRGECAEVAAAADLLLVLHLGAQTDAERLKHLAGRVSAMLTRLIARLERP